MELVLLWAIVVTGGVFAALTLVIVVNKALRQSRSARELRRREELEPKVLAYAHGEYPSLNKALGYGESSDRPVLERILLDHVHRLRGIERERLGRALAELGFVEEYLRDLSHRHWWRRARAAENLGQSNARYAVDELTARLDDPVIEVRWRAAKALGKLGGTTAMRALIPALDEPGRWSTIRIADVLTDLGAEVVGELMAAFPKLSERAKVAALDAMARVRPVHAVPWLVERLNDPSVDVRARACHALGNIGDPDVVSHLIRALRDPGWPVRALAARSLGRLRVADAVPALSLCLRDKQWWVRNNAARALRNIGGSGLRALERALGDSDRFARHQAVLMLQEAGVLDECAASLMSPDDSERRQANVFLSRVVDAGQTGRLRSLSREHPDARVRQALKSMLPRNAEAH